MDRISAKVDATKRISVADAMHYRNGLIVALLALVPPRQRTRAALRIEKHLVQSGGMPFDIPAKDTKTRRPLEIYSFTEVVGPYRPLFEPISPSIFRSRNARLSVICGL
jgi:hypothetical protein